MDAHPPVVRPPKDCDILFRALPYPDLVRPSDGKHKHQTFMLRPNENGLSLFTSIDACKAAFDSPIHGVRSVHIGRLREYGLNAFLDSRTHGNIRQANGQNIPSKHEDHAQAFQLADDLMERSRPVDYWDAPDADDQFRQEIEAKRQAKRAAAGDQPA